MHHPGCLARADDYCTASTVLAVLPPGSGRSGHSVLSGPVLSGPSTKEGVAERFGNALLGILEGCSGPPAQLIRYEQPMLLPQLWHK